jgi:GTP-binding protein HflX
VHIVDSSVAEPEMQIDAVHSVLSEIGGDDVPELLAFNKSDIAPDNAARLAIRHPGSVAISAGTGDGVDDLLRAVSDRLRALTTVVELVVPYERGDVLAAVHREGEVLVETAGEGDMRLRVRFDEAARTRFQEYVQL